MSPFNCFSSPGHVETLPRHGSGPAIYDQSSLPQMRPSPPRSPARRRSDGRRSFDGAGRDKQALKVRIGAPTAFKHVGHVGGDGAFGDEGGLASSLAAITTALHSTGSPRTGGIRSSMSAPSSAPSSPILSSHARLYDPISADISRSASAGPASRLANKHVSLPPSSSPFADASNRSPASLYSSSSQPPTPDPSKPRPVSHQPPVKRKAPPAVTASVIRAVPGGIGEAEKSGPVPTLARRNVAPTLGEVEERGKIAPTTTGTDGGTGSGLLALQELFSPSEIKAIEHYQQHEGQGEGEGFAAVGVGSPTSQEEGNKEEGSKVSSAEEGPQTKIFKGAMADIEAALNKAV
ncbi:hypothetical protein JCM11251_001476 [Rhodosporidiobolus azoricus]